MRDDFDWLFYVLAMWAGLGPMVGFNVGVWLKRPLQPAAPTEVPEDAERFGASLMGLLNDSRVLSFFRTTPRFTPEMVRENKLRPSEAVRLWGTALALAHATMPFLVTLAHLLQGQREYVVTLRDEARGSRYLQVLADLVTRHQRIVDELMAESKQGPPPEVH